MTIDRNKDRSNAEHQIDYFYNALLAYIKYPCLSAYKKAKENVQSTITAQEKSDAAYAKFFTEILVAGIAGGIGGFCAAAVLSQLSSKCAVAVVSSEQAVKNLTRAFDVGSVDSVKQAFKSLPALCATNVAKKVNVNLEGQTPVNLDDENEVESRILSEKNKATEVIYQLANRPKEKTDIALREFQKQGQISSQSFGPLEKIAIAITGNRYSLDLSQKQKEADHTALMKRFELGMWWMWLYDRGPSVEKIWVKDHYDIFIRDETFSGGGFFSGGSLPNLIQNRIKNLTGATVPQLNQYFVPHYNQQTGKILPGQSLHRAVNRFAYVRNRGDHMDRVVQKALSR